MDTRRRDAARTTVFVAAGRKGGLASGAIRRLRPSTAWRTITFAVPPADYARLTAIVERDRTRYSTLAREAMQSYLQELE